ncbi:MAG: PAS domain S-box protein, partial [Longimicrobiales bacterium]|nr:PAS domain S-box protein [Longimicrobiales bacterium]
MADAQLPSAEAYRSLVEHAPYGIFRSTRSGRIVMANPALVRILGRDSEDEVLDLDLDTDVYVDPTERERVVDQHDSGPYSDVEARWKRADGAEIVVRLSGRPVFGEDGGFLFFETFVEDVTERQRARDRLSRVLESVGAGLFILLPDEDGPYPLRPAWISESTEDLHGYSLDEALEPDFFPTGLHPEDRERVLGVADSVLERKHVVQEFRFRHRDGSYRWFHQDLRLVENVPGVGTEVIGTWVDVTDRKEAEMKLRTTKERLDRVLEASGAFVFVLVPDGDQFRFSWLSEGIRSLLGYSRREALRPGWFAMGIHPDDRARVFGSDARELADGKAIHEFRFRQRSGGYRWLREELRILEDGPDGVESVVGVAVDITDRKEAEIALREGRERLRSIMNAVPDAVIHIDSDGRIEDLNPAVERVYGYRGEELIGRPFTVLFPERFRAENSRRFQRLVSEGEAVAFTAQRMRGLHRSGKEFSAEVSVAQHEVDGEPHLTAVFRDVTERRRMEAERTKLIEELQTALREVRTLRGILPMC